MKKTSLFLFLLLITCSGAQDEIVDSQDLSDNIVKDTIVAEVTPVSYTHLTLPTNREV